VDEEKHALPGGAAHHGRDMKRRHGRQALGPYIISMAQGADDLLALLLIARRAGLEADGAWTWTSAPLFETVDDLERCGLPPWRSMLEDPVYRAHLDKRGNRQLVMLGYSDSSKISGIAASRWALYQVQEELAGLADRDGRGAGLLPRAGRHSGARRQQAPQRDPGGPLRSPARVACA
jgi:phosphoenolpyruvate carboxylase